LLLPSRWEGAPLVIAEGHRLGCIPLVTDVGAVNEMLENEVDGLVVPNETDEATAASMLAALRRLFADDGLRRALAIAGLTRSESRSWEANFAPLRAWLGI
jgi:glycosyltransferase involved in cell wall biosynthesis